MRTFIITWLFILSLFVIRLLGDAVNEFEKDHKPGVEPLMVTSHSQEDVYNEHMLLNCLIELQDLKGGGSDVK